VRADDKLHQRAKTPDRWRTKNVQPRNGCFEAFTQPRVSLEATYGICEPRRKEDVLGNVHPISCSEENMVDDPFASIVQLDFYPIAKGSSRNNGTAEFHGHVLEPRHKPSRAGWPDRFLPEPILSRPRQSPYQVRTRHNLADTSWTDIGGCIEEL